jgi:hypothetical protein
MDVGRRHARRDEAARQGAGRIVEHRFGIVAGGEHDPPARFVHNRRHGVSDESQNGEPRDRDRHPAGEPNPHRTGLSRLLRIRCYNAFCLRGEAMATVLAAICDSAGDVRFAPATSI